MTDLNQQGQVVTPTAASVKDATERLIESALNANSDFINEARLAQQRDTACVACGHDPYADTKSPLQQFLSAFLTPTGMRYMANVFASGSFMIANSYLLPAHAWTTITSGMISLFMLLPSVVIVVVLWTVLFAATALENTSNILIMIERERIYFIWNVLVAGSVFSLILVIAVMQFNDWVLETMGSAL